MPRFAALLAVSCLFLLSASAPAQNASTPDAWNKLADDFIDQYLAFSPTAATQIGVHAHDADLDDYGPASIAKQVAWLQQFEKRVLAFDSKFLNPTDAA